MTDEQAECYTVRRVYDRGPLIRYEVIGPASSAARVFTGYIEVFKGDSITLAGAKWIIRRHKRRTRRPDVVYREEA